MAIKNFQNSEQGINVRDNINTGAEINSQFNLSSISVNADYILDLEDYYDVTPQSKISIQFPSSIDGAQNARLSLDNGVTYYNVFDADGSTQLLGSDVENSEQTIKFNGTIWTVVKIGVLNKLLTTIKDSIVGAINELWTMLSKRNIETYTSLAQIGLTDADFAGLTQQESWDLLMLSLPEPCIFIYSVSADEPNLRDNLIGLGINGTLVVSTPLAIVANTRAEISFQHNSSSIRYTSSYRETASINFFGWRLSSGTIATSVSIAPGGSLIIPEGAYGNAINVFWASTSSPILHLPINPATPVVSGAIEYSGAIYSASFNSTTNTLTNNASSPLNISIINVE